MSTTTHSARVTGPVAYTGPGGRQLHIPLGPCLLEQVDESLFDIIWGAQGQRSVVMPADAVAQACEAGSLVLLD